MAKETRNASRVGPRDKAASAAEYEPPTMKPSEVPEGMSAAETEDWVSGDRARAQAAIKAEKKSSNPRRALISSLERLANDETGAGIGSGEA